MFQQKQIGWKLSFKTVLLSAFFMTIGFLFFAPHPAAAATYPYPSSLNWKNPTTVTEIGFPRAGESHDLTCIGTNLVACGSAATNLNCNATIIIDSSKGYASGTWYSDTTAPDAGSAQCKFPQKILPIGTTQNAPTTQSSPSGPLLPYPTPTLVWKDNKTITVTGFPDANSTYDFSCSHTDSTDKEAIVQCTAPSNIALTIPCAASIIFNSTTDTAEKGTWTLLSGLFGDARKCTPATSQLAVANPEKGPAKLNKTSTGGGDASTDPNLDCNVKLTNPLSWVLCPLIKMATSVIDGLDKAINGWLTVDQNKIFEEDCSNGGNQDCKTAAAYHSAWGTFRDFALALLVIFGLIMVISQALGLEIFDAYTVKKVMPRLVVAIIGIALSWELMRFFIITTNNVGLGLRQVIYYPFKDFPQQQLQLGAGSSVAVGILGGTAIAAMGFLALGSFALTAMLAVAVAFFVLIIRQLLIVMLILFAPIAIACYVLPNTNKVWKIWYESFSKALLMFPIIVAFLSLGRVFAVTSIGGNISAAPAISQLVGFAAYFLPYFTIPLTFRFAGGALGTLGNFVNDRNKGVFDRLKKYRQHGYQEHGGRRIRDAQGRILEKRANINSALLAQASKESPYLSGVGNWARKRAYRLAAGQIGGYNVEAQMSARRAEQGKILNDQIATGRDEEIRGLTVDKAGALQTAKGDQWRYALDKDGNETTTRQFKSLGGAWIDEGHVDAGQARWGRDTFAQQAALSYEMRKAGSEDEVSNLASNYARVARNAWKMNEGEASGTWIGSAFENQNTHLQFKAANWKTGDFTKDDGTWDNSKSAKFVNEVYEKKGSYPLAQMTSSTIKALQDSYYHGDTATQLKVAAIAESFVSRYGMGAGGVDPSSAESIAAATAAGRPGGMNVSVNAPGSAHVSQRLVELAQMTGVYQGENHTPTKHSTGSYPDIKPLN